MGTLIESFKPASAHIVAGYVMSAFLVVPGVAAIGFPIRAVFFDHVGWHWTQGILCLIGIGVLVGGIALARYCGRLMGRRVEFYANGFRRYLGQSVETVPWACVSQIKETLEIMPNLFGAGLGVGLLSPHVSAFYTVVTVSGKEYVFNDDNIQRIKRFGMLLREQADRFSLRWETIEVRH